MLWIEKVKSGHTVWLCLEYLRPITKLENMSRRHYVPWVTYTNISSYWIQYNTTIHKTLTKTWKSYIKNHCENENSDCVTAFRLYLNNLPPFLPNTINLKPHPTLNSSTRKNPIKSVLYHTS